MAFDPDKTYWQALRIVMVGPVSLPLSKYEVRDIGAALVTLLTCAAKVVARLTFLVLLPISAPLLAWVAQASRRKTGRDIAEQTARMRASIGGRVPTAEIPDS